ncbi:hypothetical protein [Streptomyces sp. NPDC058330]|uniref:hypothetical protein n=1 Tax=Streptomyces sp. NPDC058330 TaxID=3346449 RepID=UPI0036EA8878
MLGTSRTRRKTALAVGTAALMLLSAGGVAGAAPAVKFDPNAAPPKVHGPEKTTFAAAAGARPYWLDTRAWMTAAPAVTVSAAVSP